MFRLFFNERAEAIRLLDAYGEDVVLRLVDEIEAATQKGHERRACRIDRILQAVEQEVDRRVRDRVRPGAPAVPSQHRENRA